MEFFLAAIRLPIDGTKSNYAFAIDIVVHDEGEGEEEEEEGERIAIHDRADPLIPLLHNSPISD